MTDFTGPTAPDDSAWWQKHLAGRHLSSWPIFCCAVASNLTLATEKTSEVLRRFREAKSRGDLESTKAANVFVDANMQYNALIIGPLLGAIVLSVFATESFLWLVASCKLYETYPHAQIDAKLAELDEMKFGKRLRSVLGLIECPRLPQDLWEIINELANYRNLCAHDTPQMYSNELGRLVKFKRDRTEQTPDRRFPLPADELLPLSLGNALQAAKAHDRLVQHLLGKDSKLLERQHLLGTRWLILDQLPLVGLSTDEIERIDDAWDAELRAYVANVSVEQAQQFLKDLFGDCDLL